MQFQFPLKQGLWIKRYKRFMVDLKLDSGDVLTVHSANTGSMKNCFVESGKAWFWDSGNEKRKYPHSLELTETPSGHVACINTSRPNGLVVEAIENGTVGPLQGYTELKTEVKYGGENSRIDILLKHNDKLTYIEVKNTTLLESTVNGVPSDEGSTEEGVGFFPDSVSDRASKHLRELMRMVDEGHNAVIFFCVNHTGIKEVRPADHIDPLYGKLLRQAHEKGVQLMAYKSEISNHEIYLKSAIPVKL